MVVQEYITYLLSLPVFCQTSPTLYSLSCWHLSRFFELLSLLVEKNTIRSELFSKGFQVDFGRSRLGDMSYPEDEIFDWCHVTVVPEYDSDNKEILVNPYENCLLKHKLRLARERADDLRTELERYKKENNRLKGELASIEDVPPKDKKTKLLEQSLWKSKQELRQIKKKNKSLRRTHEKCQDKHQVEALEKQVDLLKGANQYFYKQHAEKNDELKSQQDRIDFLMDKNAKTLRFFKATRKKLTKKTRENVALNQEVQRIMLDKTSIQQQHEEQTRDLERAKEKNRKYAATVDILSGTVTRKNDEIKSLQERLNDPAHNLNIDTNVKRECKREPPEVDDNAN